MTMNATRVILVLVASACLAIVVHVLSILLTPLVAPRGAFDRVADLVPAGQVALLPDAGPSSPIPFRDPLVASAVCRYDLARGALRVSAPLGDATFLAVSFHTRTGMPFYALTDLAGNEGRVEVVLVTEAQRERAEARDPEDEPTRNIRVTAPEAEGFVLYDALPRVGGLEAAKGDLRAVTCAVEPEP